ncbi:endonuclease V [Pseudoalteromonas luteoviolacea]|uniref:Endonuclease V n=1 Tax=Pseudoalteromonas luteoviolacea TaxID=43657 RepID=A0A0C1QGN0_9GAMM|nr:deoxyribonuclease V [Pseudoalteromonas luteoviolacea]KID58500.1 endonuclease V [Pseudoalteromonas luteoviolacea]
MIQYNAPTTQEDALQIQTSLANTVVMTDQFNEIDTIAGVDVAYDEDNNQVVGAVVLLDAKTLQVIESCSVVETISFPYIPGLFSFREIPPLINAIKKLSMMPDLIVCDGQGIAHPKRFGMASHLGVLLDIPTIGCGKTKLIGEYDMPNPCKGSTSDLMHDETLIGKVLRTQKDIKPVFVSVGHKISIETAVQWIEKLTPKFRLPETTRQADQLVNRSLKALKA